MMGGGGSVTGPALADGNAAVRRSGSPLAGGVRFGSDAYAESTSATPRQYADLGSVTRCRTRTVPRGGLGQATQPDCSLPNTPAGGSSGDPDPAAPRPAPG